ncbi:MAG: response regulator transcription factor, partial [Actinomycetota bacterium]
MHSLLFIEDDTAIRTALRLALEDEGYTVREAKDGADGLAKFAEITPDLVLLDLRLPDISGFDVCRQLRQHSIVPIIMVTAQTDTHDLVAGLEAGADDYVTKPVVAKELAARIRAALRRTHLVEPTSVVSATLNSRFGDVELDRQLSVVSKNGLELSLTKTEFNLLCEFADHPG